MQNLTETRMTFEQAYKNAIMNSALYELKENSKGQQPSLAAVEAAAKQDAATIHGLVDDLCKDMTLLFGKPFKRQSMLHVFTSFMFIGVGQPLNYAINNYNTFLSGYMNGVIQTISHYRKLKWVGSDVLIDNIVIKNAEINVSKNLNGNLQKTKFNYEPYVLQGENKKSVVAIRFGSAWSKIGLVKNIQKMYYFWMGLPLSGAAFTIWLLTKFEDSVVVLMLSIISLLCVSLTVLMGINIYQKNHSPIKV